MLARRAWDDDVSDNDRLLLEWAADTIRSILVANARYANRAEHLEAECETYCSIIYGPQKGGAS